MDKKKYEPTESEVQKATQAIKTLLSGLFFLFFISFILFELWKVLVVAFTLPALGYWFWFGFTYVLSFFIKKGAGKK